MSAALRLSSTTRFGPMHLAVVAGLACAFLISKALPATKVARYLQIENKIRALVKFELAGQIPLVD